jgi:hypothetical protein
VDLGAILRGESHIGQDIGLGIVHQGGELGDPGPSLIGNLAPLFARGFGIVLGVGGLSEFLCARRFSVMRARSAL